MYILYIFMTHADVFVKQTAVILCTFYSLLSYFRTLLPNPLSLNRFAYLEESHERL